MGVGKSALHRRSDTVADGEDLIPFRPNAEIYAQKPNYEAEDGQHRHQNTQLNSETAPPSQLSYEGLYLPLDPLLIRAGVVQRECFDSQTLPQLGRCPSGPFHSA